MKTRHSLSAGSATPKIAVAASIIMLTCVGAKIYLDTRADAKREKQSKAMEDLRKLERNTSAEMTRDLNQNGGFASGTSATVTGKIRDLVDKVAMGGGSDAVAMKAFSAFLGEIQHQSEAYAEVVKQIARNNPANMRTVKDKAELARRRELARELLKRNAELMNFWSSAEVRLREKFREFGASGDTAERMVSEFSTTFAKTLPTKRRIRVADETMFKTIISMCDLLEAEWVNWEVKEDELAFADDRDAVRYNELVNALKEAVQEQAAAQRQVVEQLNELQR